MNKMGSSWWLLGAGGMLALMMGLTSCASKSLLAFSDKIHNSKRIKEFDNQVLISSSTPPSSTSPSGGPTGPLPPSEVQSPSGARPETESSRSLALDSHEESQKVAQQSPQNKEKDKKRGGDPQLKKNNKKKILQVKKNQKKQKGFRSPNRLPAGAENVKPEDPSSLRRLPDIENDEGFFEGSRRPQVDPFQVGEKVVHKVSYFGIQAGTLILEVQPFAYINGKKSYNFKTTIKSSTLYSQIYSVDDYANTYVDFETLIPTVYSMHVRESGQLRESRALFDDKTRKAKFWEQKITSSDGTEEERSLEWDMDRFSQNVFSAAYYMRIFTWKENINNAFRVSHEKENLIFRAKVIRRETLSTEAGNFDTWVVQPEIQLRGALKPVGDIFMWLTADDRKFIVRIESKIKIGTLVSEAIEIHP